MSRARAWLLVHSDTLDVRPLFLLLQLLLLQLQFLLRGKGCASLVAEWQVELLGKVHGPGH